MNHTVNASLTSSIVASCDCSDCTENTIPLLFVAIHSPAAVAIHPEQFPDGAIQSKCTPIIFHLFQGLCFWHLLFHFGGNQALYNIQSLILCSPMENSTACFVTSSLVIYPGAQCFFAPQTQLPPQASEWNIIPVCRSHQSSLHKCPSFRGSLYIIILAWSWMMVSFAHNRNGMAEQPSSDSGQLLSGSTISKDPFLQLSVVFYSWMLLPISFIWCSKSVHSSLFLRGILLLHFPSHASNLANIILQDDQFPWMLLTPSKLSFFFLPTGMPSFISSPQHVSTTTMASNPTIQSIQSHFWQQLAWMATNEVYTGKWL